MTGNPAHVRWIIGPDGRKLCTVCRMPLGDAYDSEGHAHHGLIWERHLEEAARRVIDTPIPELPRQAVRVDELRAPCWVFIEGNGWKRIKYIELHDFQRLTYWLQYNRANEMEAVGTVLQGEEIVIMCRTEPKIRA